MRIVLLSGGSGKRLWPLSNEVRSKQFLKILDNETSMLQRVYKQLERASLSDKILISTSAVQKDSIIRQVGNVATVIEPERRNTFPAIMLSCAYLHFALECSPSETVIILPVDPYVDDGFFEQLTILDTVLTNKKPELVLMGAKPTYPSQKYGYIMPVSDAPTSRVESFKEKPSLDVAKSLIRRGALWNCGVFAFKLEYMMNYLCRVMSYESYEDVLSNYALLEKNSFDYVVTEKCASAYAVVYNGSWKDIGTWNTLSEVMGEKPIGDVRMANDCDNTHVINELEIPLVVIGAKNMIIAASPDGILVSEKDKSPEVKQFADDIDMRPMFEEREWGEYKVLDITVNKDGVKVLTKRKKISAGASIEYQSHKFRSEVWTVINGKCVITINGQAYEAIAGDTYSIKENVKNGLRAITEVEIIEIQVGRELMEDGTEFTEHIA